MKKLTYPQIVAKLKKIKGKWIKTSSPGPRGVGETLEKQLGIKTNNIPGPDGKKIELKAQRIPSSMLNLFTRASLPRDANSTLLQKFGYPSSKKRSTKRLETTVDALKFNTIKGKKGLKLRIRKDRVSLIDSGGKEWAYWTKSILKESFEKNFPDYCM